jgi:phage tail sheath protein FI
MSFARPGVYITETLLPAPIQSVGGANAAGAVLGAFAQGPETVTLVRSWYDFTRQFGGYNALFPATFGVAQFFQNGGAELYVRRVLGDGAASATVAIPTSTTGTLGTATALNRGDAGNNLRIQISKVGTGSLYNVTVFKEVAASELGTDNANATNDVLVEQFNNVVFDNATSSSYASTVINATSNYISLTLTDLGVPATQALSAVLPLTGGSDGDAPVAADFANVIPADGTSDFDVLDRPLVMFSPELVTKFTIDGNLTAEADASAVHQAIIDWAAAGIGFAVIDTAPNKTVAEAISYATSFVGSSQAAVYYPNVFIQDPLSRGGRGLRKVGPAGAVVGLYLSTDAKAGPFKAPAGISSSIRNAVSLERAFTPADLDSLNTGVYTVGGTTNYGTAVNAIRNVPGAGIVAMGARTLLQDGTANRYVNMRRSLIYIKKNLNDLTQFALFENNSEKLWKQINTVISVFLNEYRNQGGLRGTTPAQAYYVKVDAENNTPESIANGEVHIEVGVALEYPTEFVVINLSQTTGL